MDLSANAFDVFNEDAKVVLCRDRDGMRRSRAWSRWQLRSFPAEQPQQKSGTMNDLAKGPHVPQ